MWHLCPRTPVTHVPGLYKERAGVRERVVGHDDERGKGDHRHHHGVETPYDFVSIERLIADFEADVTRETGA